MPIVKKLPRTVLGRVKATVVTFRGAKRRAPLVPGYANTFFAPPPDRRAGFFDILIVDTQPVSRAGIAAVLRGVPGSGVPREAETAAAALSALALTRPDLVILDISLNGPSGLDFIRQVIALHPGLRIVVFSAFPEEWYADRALRAGARGYVMKSAAPETLVQAVTRVLSGRFFVSPAVSDLVVARLAAPGADPADPTASLSDRELEVFLLIGEAFGTTEIARRLRVSVSSIESYRAGIKRKLNLTNCTQLVHAAVSCVVAAIGARQTDTQGVPPPEGPPWIARERICAGPDSG